MIFARRFMLVVLIMVVGAFGVWRYRGSADTLFLGDSIFYGLNSATRFPFTANGAAIGALTADLLDRYRVTYATQRFDRYVVLIGTNDLLNNVEDGVIHRNITALVDELQTQGGEIVLCSLLPLGDRWDQRTRLRVDEVNAWVKDYAGRNHRRYLDFHSAMAEADGSPRAGYLADGLHPTEQGYAVMTEMVTRLFDEDRST